MKNEQFYLPDHNVFDERAKDFLDSQKAKDLQKKYEPSPYEEEYKPLYYLAIIGSYLCNTISILTASTWVFSYIFSILQELPYPTLIASVSTVIVLALLEAIQRILGAKFFRTKFQYRKTLQGLFIGAVAAAGISVSFSFLGGFDLVKTVTTPPLYEAPQLEDEALVQTTYQKLVDDAQKTADDYFTRRKYKGRIATEDARKYQDYLDKKQAFQDSLLVAVNSVKARNRKKTEKAQADYQKALTAYEKKSNSKGAGLGGIAVISTLLLYLCLWYIEYYDFRTVSQYGILITKNFQQHVHENDVKDQKRETSQEPKTIEDFEQIMGMLKKQEREISKKNGATPPLSPDPKQKNTQNGTIEALGGVSLPVGFYTSTERQEQLKKLYIQQIQPYIQNFKEVQIIETDKHTVEHKNFKTGEQEFLDFKTVSNRVGIYLHKINTSITRGSLEALPNQFSKLLYWTRKRGEFLER